MRRIKLFSTARLIAAVIIGLVITIGFSSIAAFAENCDGIRNNLLRLHILANSDSEQDQQLKLAVRNRILAVDDTLFEDAISLNEAKSAAEENVSLIYREAVDEIRNQGYDYTVKVELKNMYFSTREYEKFTLPAGFYDAVRVTIGEGKGHNWWCVLYPPLCLQAAESKTKLDDVLSDNELEIVEGKNKYKIKFATVELFEGIKKYLFDER